MADFHSLRCSFAQKAPNLIAKIFFSNSLNQVRINNYFILVDVTVRIKTDVTVNVLKIPVLTWRLYTGTLM